MQGEHLAEGTVDAGATTGARCGARTHDPEIKSLMLSWVPKKLNRGYEVEGR